LAQHLHLCGNKTDECPKCKKFVRRAYFVYHYENNCASDPDAEPAQADAPKSQQETSKEVQNEIKVSFQKPIKQKVAVMQVDRHAIKALVDKKTYSLLRPNTDAMAEVQIGEEAKLTSKYGDYSNIIVANEPITKGEAKDMFKEFYPDNHENERETIYAQLPAQAIITEKGYRLIRFQKPVESTESKN